MRRIIAEAALPHFLDKEWLDVGVSGAAGEVVWIVYADFVNDDTAPLGFTSASIKAVRCDANLASCKAPILISGTDLDVQFAHVTIGSDGRVYVTWSEIQGELEQTAQTFIHKLRIAPAGSTAFGPTKIIAREALAVPFGGRLHANDFRIATYMKNEVAMIGGRPRIFVVWEACSARLAGDLPDSICEEPLIKLAFSENDGATWTQTILSRSGDNYFPTIASNGDRKRPKLAVAFFTNRFDRQFHNRQDVELVAVDAETVTVTERDRITAVSNDPETDAFLGGGFIGDYIQVAVSKRTAWVHYNANRRQIRVRDEGVPVPQQDNFLTRVSLGGEEEEDHAGHGEAHEEEED